VAITCGSKILLLKRSKWVKYHRGRWDLPGGLLNDGEDQTRAAVRECMEEAGIKVDESSMNLVDKKIGLRKGHTALRVCFKVELEEATIPDLSFEHSEFKWMSKEEIIETDLPDFYKEACLKILKNAS